MKKIILYTDGACSYNPGPGGWGAILSYGNYEKEISGAEQNTTNNKMELTAVIKGLELLKEPCDVDLYSDSAYVVEAFLQNWILGWKQHGWKLSNNKEVKNIELWQNLDRLCSIHKVTWHKVKGHATNEKNNRCDKLATTRTKELIELIQNNKLKSE